MNFESLPTTLYGDLGEDILSSHMVTSGSSIILEHEVTLWPDERTQGHDIDFLVQNNFGMKFYADAKCKPRFKHLPITGFDAKDLDHYIRIQDFTGLPVSVFFIDFYTGLIKYNIINNLIKPYSKEGMQFPYYRKWPNSKIELVHFHLSKLLIFDELTDKEISQLKDANSLRNYTY